MLPHAGHGHIDETALEDHHGLDGLELLQVRLSLFAPPFLENAKPDDKYCKYDRFLHPTLPFCLDLTWGSPMLETKVILFMVHMGRNQAWIVKRTLPPPAMFDAFFAPAFRVRLFALVSLFRLILTSPDLGVWTG